MFRRLRTTSLAGSGALVLVLVVSGVVAAASLLTAIAAPVADPDAPPVVDTSRTWEDVDGDGLDDDCDDAVEANEDAAQAADEAVDLDGDGTISVSEAAQSERIGGVNCNHGGYVSWVAHETCGTDEATDADEGADEGTEDGAEEVNADEAVAEETEPEGDDAAADCEATEEEEPAEETTEETPEEEQPAECEATTPDEGTTPEDGDTEEPAEEVVKNGHGKVVRLVAQDKEAVGGKNCNHGGAVSEASHEDNEARKAAREAEKEARNAARDAAKAAREAARETKSKGGKGHNH